MVTTSRISGATRTGSKGGAVIDGLDLVVNEFRWKAVTAPVQAGAAVVKHAGLLNQRMKNRVPIGPDDWHVLNSLTADQTPSTNGKAVWADAGPDPEADEGAFVARFLEYGTTRQPPQPFIAPSADETMPDFVKDIGDIV